MRRPLASLAVVVAVAMTGCGATGGATPPACLEGADAFIEALRTAPAAVKLRDDTPISDCLAENQQAGDLATVGTALVVAATRLNAEARAEPGGDANVQLGYLLGAAQRGADASEGIHAELIRRLTTAARYSPDNRPLPAAFLRAYREGFDAGHGSG